MLKIGDKVKIKTNLRIYAEKDSHIYSYMDYYCAEDISTIENINRDGYKLFGYHFPFPESMLEPVKEDNNMNEMPKLETGMIIVNKYDRIGIVVNDFVWHYDDSIDAVENILTYIQEYEDDDYIKYIIKCKYGFKHIQNNLPNIKSNKPVTGIEVLWKYEEPIPEVTMEEIYEKFGHKVKIVPEK